MFESRHQKLLPRKHFIRRQIKHAIGSVLLVGSSLLLGMAGYHLSEGLSWIDSFLNASMLLGGMGPVNSPQSEAGKLFAGMYALYAGLVFLIAVGLLLAPAFHRMLHRFHWDERNGGGE